MTSDAAIEQKYERAMRNVAALNPIFPHQAKQQMAALIEEAVRSDGNIQQFLSHNTTAARRGGFVAEEFHATTFNMDSILKGKSLRAETGMDNHLIGNNDRISDVIVTREGAIQVRAQSKYNADAATTAKQHSRVDVATGSPKYEGADVTLSPADQVEAVRQHALERAAHHDAKAQATASATENLPASEGHQAQAQAYRQTADKASATLEHDGVSSRPLSKSEADTLGDRNMDKLDGIRSEFETASTVQQMGRAAAGAAAMAAVVAGTINTVRYLDLVRRGEMSTSDATIKIVVETSAAAADSAVKASLVTGTHSVLTRLAGEAAVSSMAKQGLGAMLRTNVVTAGVVCAVDAVKDLVLLAKGDLTTEEFEERQGKGMLNTAAGTMGASLGTAAITAVAGSIAFAPFIGALTGGIIASVAMSFAIEAQIEGPYRELAGNTTRLRDSARLLESLSQTVFEGQIHFTAFLSRDLALDTGFHATIEDGAAKSANMKTAIDRI
jgi:hypothetical protein